MMRPELFLLGVGSVAFAALVAWDWRTRFTGRFTSDSRLGRLPRTIFLTFDDGPSSSLSPWGDSREDAGAARRVIEEIDPAWDFDAGVTENLARVLAELDARAMFFVRGDVLERDPGASAVVGSLRRAGHVVGSHAFSHSRLATLTVEECLAEMLRTDVAIQRATGDEPVMFRPPWGEWRFPYTRKLWKVPGLSRYALPLGWTHSTGDWARPARSLAADGLRSDVAAFLHGLRERETGVVLLQHDVWVYSALFTRLLVESLRGRQSFEIGEPERLERHAQTVSLAARRLGGAPFYAFERIRSATSRLGCLAGVSPAGAR